MAVNIQEIAGLWANDEPQYKQLGKIVSDYIKSGLPHYEILPEISSRTKDLLSIVKKIKKKQREKQYDYSSLWDKLGIRIICTFQEDLDKVDTFLKDNFVIKKAELKRESINFDRLDYTSNHYDVTINTELKGFENYSKYKDYGFEIQVRTINQHAWSNTAHSLSYKQEAELQHSLKRRVYRLLSLYEIADDEFSHVNKVLLDQPDTKVYWLLRKLEGKIYKYAQMDFDRDISLHAIKILMSFFSEENQKILFSQIDTFIEENESKIIRIFSENRNRFYEFPFLTQPEIFIVWFGLEKFQFSIDDNWNNEFDSEELVQITSLWGKIIN